MKKILIKIILKLARKNLIKMSDKTYLTLLSQITLDKKCDIENPETFNEKLQWLKLYDRKPKYTEMADKYEVKKYVSNIIGEEYIIPTLGIYEKFEDIDFSKLPNQFVIKTTHDSGGVVICKDKANFDIEYAKNKIEKSLKRKYYNLYKEWAYKNIKPRILIEKYIGDGLTDYRIYCFNEVPKYVYMYICECEEKNVDKPEPVNCNIYDTKWELQNFRQKSLPTKKIYKKPEQLEKLLRLASKLSRDTNFLRVDFYIVDNRILFSELTFYPGGGISKFYPEEADYMLGKMLDLKD